MTKMGYFYNQAICSGCRTCQIACKDKNELPIGVLFRNVTSYEVGRYPKASIYHLSQTCNHCVEPSCVKACPSGAMYKDEDDGTIQHDDRKCIACQYCVSACPYGNPKFIPELNVVHKCDACKALRDNGEQPACVSSCIMRALEFGPYDDLVAAHPEAVGDIVAMPDSAQTSPCTLIQPKAAALAEDVRQIVL